ncbi:MAG: hypothetical protein J7L39_02285, partial [Candidatus Aenigmarchaeota archaeon]|nr:hypothetical protein [Candidatus Aenigmarchaeota archaeon]
MEEYIKLDKKMITNLIPKKSKYFLLWIYLLLNAVPDETEIKMGKKSISLKKGQLITSRRKLARLIKTSETEIERILKYFENGHQIGQQTFNRFRVITIKNYNQYFEIGHQNGHQQHILDTKMDT